jgi:hypothetical protein
MWREPIPDSSNKDRQIPWQIRQCHGARRPELQVDLQRAASDNLKFKFNLLAIIETCNFCTSGSQNPSPASRQPTDGRLARLGPASARPGPGLGLCPCVVTSAKWGVHIHDKYAEYRPVSILHIPNGFAYFLTYFLHILHIILHIFCHILHIILHISCYILHIILHIFVIFYILHIILLIY